MTTVALQTSRAGSESVRNKNCLLIGGQPLYQYNLKHAKKCPSIDSIFAVTDISEVQQWTSNSGMNVVALPPDVSNANHYQAIRYGLKEVETRLGCEIDIVIILLGNSLGAESADLECAIQNLKADATLDSVCSVSEFNAFNPGRAMRVGPQSLLETVVPQDILRKAYESDEFNTKTAMGVTLFFNGSFWVCRRKPLVENAGMLPFTWLGNRILPFRQRTFMEIDAPWQVPMVELLRNPGNDNTDTRQ